MKSLLPGLTLIAVAALVGCASTLHAEPLVTKFGTGTILHPLQEPENVPLPKCYEGGNCRCAKEHVHIFAVNGVNPLCLGNFNGLCGYCKKQGFEHTYFGQLVTSHWFSQKIRDVRRCDPEAKIVLVGFSAGANYVEGIANNLAKDGTRVDLLVYLVGDFIGNRPACKPDNVCRIVNFRAKGLLLSGGDLFFNGEDIDGARNVHLDCRHMLAPSRRETLEVLMEELLTVGCVPEEGPATEGPATERPASGVAPATTPPTTKEPR